jgi:hypothetical protein
MGVVVLAFMLFPGFMPVSMCVSIMPAAKALKAADCVFLGHVIQKDVPGPRPISDTDPRLVEGSNDMVRYVLVAESGWKGELSDTLVVYSERENGYGMSLDERYLLFAWLERNPAARGYWTGGTPTSPALVVGACVPNHHADYASETLEVLGDPTWVPRQNDPSHDH